jgi:ribosome-binding protein aMBF1 (putative translation factor)
MQEQNQSLTTWSQISLHGLLIVHMSADQHRQFLGQAIRAKRRKLELSQEKLAEKAGLSTVFISRVERAKESPSVDSLVKIARALNVPVRKLVADF